MRQITNVKRPPARAQLTVLALQDQQEPRTYNCGDVVCGGICAAALPLMGFSLILLIFVQN